MPPAPRSSPKNSSCETGAARRGGAFLAPAAPALSVRGGGLDWAALAQKRRFAAMAVQKSALPRVFLSARRRKNIWRRIFLPQICEKGLQNHGLRTTLLEAQRANLNLQGGTIAWIPLVEVQAFAMTPIYAALPLQATRPRLFPRACFPADLFLNRGAPRRALAPPQHFCGITAESLTSQSPARRGFFVSSCIFLPKRPTKTGGITHGDSF